MDMDELAVIEQQIQSLKKELTRLEARKRSILASCSQASIETNTLSPNQKIALFRNYFKGNERCYAVRWQNQQGRSGYSIACQNEWQQGVCNKPKVKCLECGNQAFKLLNQDAIYSHLSGQQTVGLYPMTEDNHCWLLAVDFDKKDWQEASIAYARACKQHQIDCLLERSRSGNGAHVWIFFERTIPAKAARQLGFYLLDQAMHLHGVLSFDSYDRLFPNQDILPVAGIGNLIALPLQKVSREHGNSVFVDEHFIPYPDQWEALSSTQKTTQQQVQAIVGQEQSEYSDKQMSETSPWERTRPPIDAIPDSPNFIDITLANRVYLPLKSLPNALIARLKRLASFSNPKFFKAQAMRLSTNGISRFISLAEVEGQYLSLPRGCFDDIQELLFSLNIQIRVDDKRHSGVNLETIKFVGSLRTQQSRAIKALIKHDVGVLHAPTAFGKTITAIGLICERKVSTLILVHNKQLVEQWQERLKAFTSDVEVGVFSGAKKKPTKQVDIATYQSLFNRSDNTVHDMVHEYGQIIVDECHHLSAPQYERVLTDIHARYVIGISATLERRDGHQPIIFMQTGRVRHTIQSNKANQFVQTLVKKELPFEPPLAFVANEPRPHIADIYRWLTEHAERNKTIIDDINQEVVRGRVPIVLTERREHAKQLSDALTNKGISNEILVGSMKKKSQEEVMERLSVTQVLVATGRFVGEGFDLPRLDTLVLALPVSWKGSLIQYVGRIQREFEGKSEIKVIDYVDVKIPMLNRMFTKRDKGYRALGFTCKELQIKLI
ncbi:DEAD/DEAH box helicase [Photobacterium sagamiensis]|uniref:TOTE conflict system archaeo-eukaryotic primase domain-containing protein n=1 Tax=Photobacterium sagamiensis TaxID=2910241 RepID=UPI003D12D208